MDSAVIAEGLTKRFGATTAVNSVSLEVGRGRITALLGGNGAGKSTLTRILSGTQSPNEGGLVIENCPIDFGNYSPQRARVLGIRVVHQELSLCTNLTVGENVLLEFPSTFRGIGWRGKAERAIKGTLDAIFPQNQVRTGIEAGALSLAERQMVEIARALLDPRLKILVLDEPTSSLDGRRAHQLLTYLRQRSDAGLSVIFIGHRLGEILDLAQEFLVMRDGYLVWSGSRQETTEQDLIKWLSAADKKSESLAPQVGRVGSVSSENRAVRVEINRPFLWPNALEKLELRAGEIVGLAGLEGSGQVNLLRAIYRTGRHRTQDVRRCGSVSYVTGDRQKEGVFALWSTLLNMTIARQMRRRPWCGVSEREERNWAVPWTKRFSFSKSALEKPIIDLSGGNQQKALFTRALLTDTDTFLLDDPTRGVDVGVKAEFYQTLQELAAAGKLIVWHSSEDVEFQNCSRVLIFLRGRVVKEISGLKASREELVATAFGLGETVGTATAEKSRPSWHFPNWLIPLLALVIVMVAIGSINPHAVSSFGIELLLAGAMPLTLVSLGQMYVVGRSEIDLGIGGFAGLTNVISATLLVEQPFWGILALLAGLGAYALLGALIYLRRIPAIVATLGSSFVWIGLGYALQPMPGGACPDWLSRFFNLSIPIVPFPVLVIAASMVVAALLLRTRFGIVLRGFGNNLPAMRELGWPAVRFHVWTYLTSGLFGLAAGLCLTGVNTASDVNAAVSYTLLSVAAVVMGGCDLVGGRIDPIGVVLASVTLALLGALLGFLQVSSDFIAALQGLILLGIVVLRTRLWRSS
jgi:ribose transport system ATP-binding protein